MSNYIYEYQFPSGLSDDPDMLYLMERYWKGLCRYCTVLYFTVLNCTELYCTVLHCTVLYCTVLYCTVLYCTVLYCTVLCGGAGTCWPGPPTPP